MAEIGDTGAETGWQVVVGPLLILLVTVGALIPSLAPAHPRAGVLARVSFPTAWAFPLVLLAGALLLSLTALGLHRDRHSLAGLGVGMSMSLMVAVFVTLVAILGWRIGTLLAPVHFNRWLAGASPTVSAWLFFAGLVALALAVFGYRYQRALRQEPLPDLTAGVLLNWFLFSLLTALATPDISYLFFWPLLAALPYLAWNSFGQVGTAKVLSRPGWLLALLRATVALLLWVPFLIRFFLAQGLGGFFIQTGAIVFVAGMLLPLLAPLLYRDRGLLAELSFLASLALSAAGLVSLGR